MTRTNEDVEEVIARARVRARRWVRDASRADDLVQDACLAVVRAGGAWTFGYLVSAMRSRLADSARRARIVKFEELTEAGDIADVATTDLAARVDARARATSLLRDLTREQREWLWLVDVEGLTTRELAERTGRSRTAVLSALHRIKRRLREEVPE